MQYDIQFVPTQYLEKSAEEPNTIYIWMTDPVSSSGSNLLGWTAWDEKTNGAYMYITPNMTDDQLFTAVMLHEFGHAFHLIHYTLPNLSIMHPIVCEDTCHVECVDIKAFCKIWNCSTECAITPDAVLPTNTLIEEVNINTCSLSK
jgi:hypothetical protein